MLRVVEWFPKEALIVQQWSFHAKCCWWRSDNTIEFYQVSRWWTLEPGWSPHHGSSRIPLQLFTIILNLWNSLSFRNHMLDEPLLERLACFHKRMETTSFQLSTLLRISKAGFSFTDSVVPCLLSFHPKDWQAGFVSNYCSKWRMMSSLTETWHYCFVWLLSSKPYLEINFAGTRWVPVHSCR